MEWSIFNLENSFISVTKSEAGDIPFIKFSPKGFDDNIPTVIYYHGWSSSKEFKRFQAMSIASFGYNVIVPDALYHGERGKLDYYNPESIGKHLWEIISQSVLESDDLINHLVSECNINKDQIYIMGSSMGAVTAAGIFAKNKGIKGLAGFNGAFSWGDAIEHGTLPNADKYSEFVENHDLSKHMEKINDRPILILHGVNDSSVPFVLQKKFYDQTEQELKNVELIDFSNIDHRVTTSMMENLIAWLKDQTR